ncbi:MAG: type IV secretion system DNA-binding domain-containing protein [Candidatus Aminicenantes bacterium]|nr:type IV secretion system DNA-binding domain-containing protein [Candidatus Aminicenantes bacterium]
MSKNLMAHESAVASFKMFSQMVLISFLISALIQIMLIIILIIPGFKELKAVRIPPKGQTIATGTMFKFLTRIGEGISNTTSIPDEFIPLFSSNKKLSGYVRNGNQINVGIFKKVLNSLYGGYFEKFPDELWKVFKSSSYVYSFMFLYIAYFLIKSQGIKGDRFLRGTRILTGKEMKKRLRSCCFAESVTEGWGMNLKVGDMFLPREAEQKHTLILGSTGTGKTVFFNQIISQTIKRQEKISVNEKSVIYDIKGELLSKHFRPESDVIFYPFDIRSTGWSFMNEIRTYADFDVMSSSLFEPPKDSKDSYWYNAARDIFRAGLYFLYSEASHGDNEVKVSNSKIWDFFTLPVSEISEVLNSGLPSREKGALKHIENPESPQASSVLSVLQERISFFKYIYDTDGDFSFRQFINENRNRNLFLLNIKQNDSVFRPLMTFVIDIMIRESLSLPDITLPADRRINFFIDEFGTLSKMSSVFDFLTMARAKGGALYVVNQDLGSISDIYGKEKKETFFNNFNTNFIFLLNDPTTAEFISRAFGEQELIQKSGDRQISPNSLGDTYTHREQYKINKVLLPSQFIELEPFRCYFKYSGVGFTKIGIEKLFFDSKYIPYQEKEFKILKDKSNDDAEGYKSHDHGVYTI